MSGSLSPSLAPEILLLGGGSRGASDVLRGWPRVRRQAVAERRGRWDRRPAGKCPRRMPLLPGLPQGSKHLPWDQSIHPCNGVIDQNSRDASRKALSNSSQADWAPFRTSFQVSALEEPTSASLAISASSSLSRASSFFWNSSLVCWETSAAVLTAWPPSRRTSSDVTFPGVRSAGFRSHPMAVSNPARINIQTNRDIIKSPVERSLLSPGDGCRIRQEPCRRSQGPSRAWQHGERVATTTRSGDRASTVANGGRYLRGLGWWRCCSPGCLENGCH